MPEYLFFVSEDGEALKLDSPSEKADENWLVHGGTLFLASELIRAFYPLIKGQALPGKKEVWQALDVFTKNITGLPFIGDKPIKLKDLFWERMFASVPEDMRDEAVILAEVNSLSYAITNWLGNLETPDLRLDGWAFFFSAPRSIAYGFANYCLYHRSRQITTHPETHPELFGGKLLRVHESRHGLLPLCWAEVWYCLEHKKRARVCPYCGKVFLPPPNNPKTAYCQGGPCRRAYLIEKHGGIEGYREWERTRKKKSSGKRGRPRKVLSIKK